RILSLCLDLGQQPGFMWLLEPPICARLRWSVRDSARPARTGRAQRASVFVRQCQKEQAQDFLWEQQRPLELRQTLGTWTLFSWPVAEDQSNQVSLSHEELSLLLGGIDLMRTQRKDWYRKTVPTERNPEL